MSTCVFDKVFVIDDIESAEKLIEIMTSDDAVSPIPENPFFRDNLKRGEELLKQCLLRSKR